MEQEPLKKRKRQAMETRERIFNAAVELINEKGFENVQIEDISNKAYVSMGLFYKYFSNKADIITEVFFSQISEQYQVIYDRHLIGKRGFRKIILFCHYIAELHMLHEQRPQLRYHYSNILSTVNRGSWVTNGRRLLYTVLTQAVKEAKEDGECPADTNETMAVGHIALMIRGAVFEYLLREDADTSFNLITAVDQLISHYLSGLKVRPVNLGVFDPY